MARRVTSGIKQRKRTTVYLTEEVDEALDRAYIEVQRKVLHRVDRTLFFDALFKAGLKHQEEIERLLSHEGRTGN